MAADQEEGRARRTGLGRRGTCLLRQNRAHAGGDRPGPPRQAPDENQKEEPPRRSTRPACRAPRRRRCPASSRPCSRPSQTSRPAATAGSTRSSGTACGHSSSSRTGDAHVLAQRQLVRPAVPGADAWCRTDPRRHRDSRRRDRGARRAGPVELRADPAAHSPDRPESRRAPGPQHAGEAVRLRSALLRRVRSARLRRSRSARACSRRSSSPPSACSTPSTSRPTRSRCSRRRGRPASRASSPSGRTRATSRGAARTGSRSRWSASRNSSSAASRRASGHISAPWCSASIAAASSNTSATSDGIQRQDPAADLEGAGAAHHRRNARSRRCRPCCGRPPGCNPTWSASASSPSGRRTADCARPCSSACGRTRRPKRSRPRRPDEE